MPPFESNKYVTWFLISRSNTKDRYFILWMMSFHSGIPIEISICILDRWKPAILGYRIISQAYEKKVKKDLVGFMCVIMNGKLGKQHLLKGYQKIIEK